MAANKSNTVSRREREQRTRRTERMVIIGAAGVLAVATVVVLVGLYVTQYLPPRAHVLTVGESEYNAGEVARRATFEVLFGRVTPNTAVVIPETLEALEDQEIVLSRAPEVVGDVTAQDLDDELRDRLGFSDADDEDNSAFGEALATLLRQVDLPRDEYDLVVSVEILLERLDEQFRTEIGEEADQLLISRIRLVDQVSAEELRAQLLEGADFAELSEERTSEGGGQADDGDLGWVPLALFSEAAQDALAGLAAAELSEIVADGPFSDVYLVAEREDARALEPQQIDALAALRQSEWIDERRDSVAVENDLSRGEEEWILERVTNNVNDAQAVLPATSRGGG